MMSWAALRPWIVVVAVALPWFVVWPSSDRLIEPVGGVDAPLDNSLRVPFGAAFLTTANTDFETHDRVLDIVFGDNEQTVFPRNREELRTALEESPSLSVTLRLARGRGTSIVHATPVTLPGWRAISRNWPLVFLGAVFLVFGLTIALGSKHPVTPPLFVVAWCVGANLLAQLDLVLPEDSGLHGIASLRSRLGVVSLTLLPASFIHLAMRFPVVAPRLRSPAVVAVPYVFWLFPAAFAQLHLDDATFLNTLEKVSIGTTFVAAGILAIGSLTAIRTMTPIERARTRALLFGLGLGSAVPFVYFVWGGKAPPEFRTPFVLSLLAFPAAISWAVVRYRLLDPPAWVRGAFLTGLTAVVALLCASALVSMALSFLGEPAATLSVELVPVALTTAVLYQLLHLGLQRGAGSRVLRQRAFEQFLEQASRDLSVARQPEAVLRRVEALIRAHLGASEVRCVTKAAAAFTGEPLVTRGCELWDQDGAPLHRIVRSRTRAEDPGPDLAEIVVPLVPQSAPEVLIVLGSRADGLPYDDEHERMLVSLRHVATTALQAAATTADLEAKVADKTSSLQRALADRQAVLRSARAISEADSPDEIWVTLQVFAAARVDPPRQEELAPQIETLHAFAGLAIGRLELLAELKREVERQAQEIAEISSRRLHAEFVRGVAHELRKPTEEVRNRLEQLAALLPLELSEALERIRAASREMSRRLDLLLFHSGLRIDPQRIDLVRVVDDAVEAARASGAARDFRIHHDLRRLPMLADPSRILSVVENLLDNGIKATQEGQGIAVRTSLERDRSHRGNWVQIEFLDEGHGIPPDQLDQIFEPGVGFEGSGFGLGLSLCREIVRMHGGTIDVASRRGCTVFRIRLPQFRSGEGDDSNSLDPPG
jgi:signal transduction histidine kinase